MDLKRIMLGLAAWFLGIIVPVSHRIILVTLALRSGGQSTNIIYRLWEGLLWIDFVYLLGMGIVGAILIITGMKKSSQ